MKALLSCTLTFALLTVASAPAFAQETSIALTNADVIMMVKAKVPAEVIVEKIKTSNCRFDTFPSVLSELKQRGVPDGVLMAMVKAPSGPPRVEREAVAPMRNNPAARPDGALPPGQYVTLADGTEFGVTPTEEINSKKAVEGDIVTFRVLNDVMAEGSVVIKKGAIARGTVTDVEKRGMLGKGGKLSVRIEGVAAVDGQKVRLRASKGREGGSNTGKVIALSLLVTPLFLLMRGNTARLKEGQVIQVFTDEQKSVRVGSESSAASAQEQ